MSRDSKKIGGRGWVRRSTGRVAAMSRHWPPDPDSGHPGEAVCYRPVCQISRIDPQGRRLLLSLPCYSMFRVVSASKQ